MSLIDEIKIIETNAELLYSKAQVETALDKIAENINSLLYDRNPVLLCVLNGGIVTAGKLLTRLNFPLTIDSINLTRYQDNVGGETINWIQKPAIPLQNRTVLIVDDILDAGLTLEAIYNYCQEQGATSIYSAVLIEKTLDQQKPVKADFIGLTAINRYLFGYGMDYKGYLRNAQGIYACQED
jgi:hypoxanthine phosphoribosyltransferase